MWKRRGGGEEKEEKEKVGSCSKTRTHTSESGGKYIKPFSTIAECNHTESGFASNHVPTIKSNNVHGLFGLLIFLFISKSLTKIISTIFHIFF